jgi:hypothetical protein
MSEKDYNPEINIKIEDWIMKGAFANAASVVHTKDEFVIDFMNINQPKQNGIVTARIIMTPGHTKRMLKALKENIEKYEQQFDKIE